MNDGYALLRAIEANPDDDTPRLVYADWLDENAATDADRARAEFIRVQCELARDPPAKRRSKLTERERELLDWHHREWIAAYPFPAPPGSFTRGFMYLTLDAADFAKHGERLAALTPLHFLKLTDGKKALARVAKCPALQYVRHLALDYLGLNSRNLSPLLDSPHLTNVRVLGLASNRITKAGCAALAATKALPALRVLSMSDNSIGDEGAEALIGAPWFSRLAGLYIPNCRVRSAVATELARPGASGLRSLSLASSLWGSVWRDEAARAILDSPHLAQLKRLWYPMGWLSAPVRAEMEKRFGANLNLTSYRIDWIGD